MFMLTLPHPTTHEARQERVREKNSYGDRSCSIIGRKKTQTTHTSTNQIEVSQITKDHHRDTRHDLGIGILEEKIGAGIVAVGGTEIAVEEEHRQLAETESAW